MSALSISFVFWMNSDHFIDIKSLLCWFSAVKQHEEEVNIVHRRWPKLLGFLSARHSQCHCGSLKLWTLSNICKGFLCSTDALYKTRETHIHRWEKKNKVWTLPLKLKRKSYKSSAEELEGASVWWFLFCTVVLSAWSSDSSSDNNKKTNISASPLKLYSSITRCFTSWTNTATCCTYFCRRDDLSSIKQLCICSLQRSRFKDSVTEATVVDFVCLTLCEIRWRV